jgi:hypothetical protein
MVKDPNAVDLRNSDSQLESMTNSGEGSEEYKRQTGNYQNEEEYAVSDYVDNGIGYMSRD